MKESMYKTFSSKYESTVRKIGDLNFSEIKRLREVFQQMFCE